MREEDLSYFQSKEFQRILQNYEKAQQDNSSIYLDADELTDIAEYYMVNNQEEMANKAISLALELHPESIDPQVFLARQEMFHDHLTEATEICNAIYEQNDREVIFLRAELLIRKGLPQEADLLIQETCEQICEDKDQFIYDSIGVFMDYNLWELAQNWCDILRERYPNYPGIDEIQVEIYFYCGKFELAIDTLNTILDRNPYDVNAWIKLSQSYCATKRYSDAVEACEFALAIDDKNPKALYGMACTLYEKQDFAKAHHYLVLTKQVQTTEKDLTLHLDAMCLAAMNRPEEGIPLIQEAALLTLDSELKEIYEVMICILENEKRLPHEQLLNKLRHASLLVVNNRETLSMYDLHYGQVMLENQRYKSCKEHFKIALEDATNPIQTLLMIGLSFFENEKLQEAIDVFKVIDLKAPQTDYSDIAQTYTAACYQRLGYDNMFLKLLKQISIQNPNLTESVLGDMFPGTPVKDYYKHAYQKIFGHFPEENQEMD